MTKLNIESILTNNVLQDSIEKFINIVFDLHNEDGNIKGKIDSQGRAKNTIKLKIELEAIPVKYNRIILNFLITKKRKIFGKDVMTFYGNKNMLFEE